MSGVVRTVGANVKQFKPGDRVLALSNATYAELVAVDDSEVIHLPDGVELADTAELHMSGNRAGASDCSLRLRRRSSHPRP